MNIIEVDFATARDFPTSDILGHEIECAHTLGHFSDSRNTYFKSRSGIVRSAKRDHEEPCDLDRTYVIYQRGDWWFGTVAYHK